MVPYTITDVGDLHPVAWVEDTEVMREEEVEDESGEMVIRQIPTIVKVDRTTLTARIGVVFHLPYTVPCGQCGGDGFLGDGIDDAGESKKTKCLRCGGKGKTKDVACNLDYLTTLDGQYVNCDDAEEVQAAVQEFGDQHYGTKPEAHPLRDLVGKRVG